MKVFIHVGPPKSGTSAIQNWCHSNQDFLLENGIYYPDHKMGPNGISSGHELEVLHKNIEEKSPKNRYMVDREKVALLLEKFEKTKAPILLISSEMFVVKLSALKQAFPKSTFIGYVRSPLDTMESSYNQHVKRKLETSRFKPGGFSAGALIEIKEYIQNSQTDDFILRAYWKNLDILEDFLSIFQVSMNKSIAQSTINPSYCYEALEFKRWANNFVDITTSHALDKLLQNYQGEITRYSLLEPASYEFLRTEAYRYIEEFARLYEIANVHQLLAQIERTEQKPYVNKELSSTEIQAIFDYVRETRPKIYNRLLSSYNNYRDKQQRH